MGNLEKGLHLIPYLDNFNRTKQFKQNLKVMNWIPKKIGILISKSTSKQMEIWTLTL